MNKVVSVFSFLFVAFLALPSFAADGAATDYFAYVALGAGLAIAIAAAGGGIGQGRAAAAWPLGLVAPALQTSVLGTRLRVPVRP